MHGDRRNAAIPGGYAMASESGPHEYTEITLKTTIRRTIELYSIATNRTAIKLQYSALFLSAARRVPSPDVLSLPRYQSSVQLRHAGGRAGRRAGQHQQHVTICR